VDSRSLPGLGPVHMLIPHPDPSKLVCTLPHFFFGKGGQTLVVEVEGDDEQSRSTNPSPDPDQPRHDDDVEEDDMSLGGDSENGSVGNGDGDAPLHATWGGPATPSVSVPPAGQSTLAGTVPTTRSKGSPTKMGLLVPRDRRYDTVESLGFPIMQYGSNISQDSSVSVGLEVCPPTSPRSLGLVCYSCSLGSTPSLK
jgi:hypothetical protein